MASIFYAWELGANLGHIGKFLPIAKILRDHGHIVNWVVAHPHQATLLLQQAEFAWMQAPTIPEQNHDNPPLNYGDILLRFGYANSNDLLGLVVAWRTLLQLTKAQIVIADHAPTAILAARSLGIPVMLLCTSFSTPPQVHPTPNMRHWLSVPHEKLVNADLLATSNINRVLAHFKRTPITYLAELFQVEEDALCSYPELDHYPNRRPARYWGMLSSAVADIANWPDAPGPRIFAYVRPETPHLEAALNALHQLRGSVIIYSPGLSNELTARYSASHLFFSPTPVDLNTIASQATAAVNYASPAATIAFLMAGKPVLMIPQHLEQYLFARRVEELGAGLIHQPEAVGKNIQTLLHRILNEPKFTQGAAAFANKYKNFDQETVMNNIVSRIESIVSDH